MKHDYKTKLSLLMACIGIAASQSATYSDYTVYPPGKSAVFSDISISINATQRAGSLLIYIWQLNEEEIARVEYRTTTNKPYPSSDDSTKYNVSAKGSGINLGMELILLKVTIDEYNGTRISVRVGSEPSAGDVQIKVNECPRARNETYVAELTSCLCGLGCTANFTCKRPYNGVDVTASCQINAEWDQTISCQKVQCNTSDIPLGNCTIEENVILLENDFRTFNCTGNCTRFAVCTNVGWNFDDICPGESATRILQDWIGLEGWEVALICVACLIVGVGGGAVAGYNIKKSKGPKD